MPGFLHALPESEELVALLGRRILPDLPYFAGKMRDLGSSYIGVYDTASNGFIIARIIHFTCKQDEYGHGYTLAMSKASKDGPQ
jgi:hypothetical protein